MRRLPFLLKEFIDIFEKINKTMNEKPKVILELEDKLGVEVDKYQLNVEKKIVSLDFRNKQIIDLSPLHNKNYYSLRNLSFSNSVFNDINSLSKLVNLTNLSLPNNSLSDISIISRLINLTLLDLSNNSISNLEEIKRLKLLRVLNLSNNVLTDNDSLSILTGFENMMVLGLSNNQFRDIRLLSTLRKLKGLYLSNNYIKDISSLKTLNNIGSLLLSNNQISDVSVLSKLIEISNADIRFNNIENISITDISEKKYSQIVFNEKYTPFSLNFYGNPLQLGIKNAILSGGKDKILRYLDSFEKGSIKIEEAKMILLGEPRAGKTTLQKYLMGLQINEVEESTPDIQISSWKPFEFDDTDSRDIKINLWDFGGQEIQYSLHKLFMTEDTLYVIVLDSTKDQNPQKYLEFLENYAPNSPFIIINNQGDAPTSNTLKIDENYLRETYDGRNGKPILKRIFHRVSFLKAAKLDQSWRKIMDEVVETIKDEILNLRNLNKEFPKSYLQVKQAIESEYDKPDKHYITMSYYRELCLSLRITDNEELRKSILLYLNQIGVLRHFKDSPLTDRHILNPKWLIEGSYSLIIDELTATNFGVITHEQACAILKRAKFKFFENDAYFIFKTMQHFGLLHNEESEKKLYIPIRFSSEQPIILREFIEKGKHFVFDFKSNVPEDVIPTLIVKHFKEIRNRQYWSKGAVFEKENVRILVRIEDRNIHFFVLGDYHQNYFAILRNTLKEMLTRLPGLLYDEIVSFEFEGKSVKAKYNDLVSVIIEGWGDYRDYSSRKRIKESEIIKVLGGYFSNYELSHITSITNNFYGTFNDNRYQQITVIQELNSLVQLAQNINDKKALEEISSEIQLLNQTNDVEKKESLGKKLLGKIKKLSTDSLDDVVKEKLKELFPKIVEKGIDWIEKVDFDGIMQIFGGIL
jgi:internalin A